MKSLTLTIGLGLALGAAGFAQSVTGLRLINADTNLAIAAYDPLAEGTVLDLAMLPTRNLSFEAITEPAVVGSVRFGYDGNTNFRTESVAPYSFTGDANGNFAAFTPEVGAHVLSATAFSGSGGGGTQGAALSINFTVTDGPPPDPEESAVLETRSKGVYGELKKWHRVTVAFEGPESSEGATPNPFLDYRLNVTFTHVPSGRTLLIPGYFAADGFAGETAASSGNIWRVHFSPPESGEWTYRAEFRTGADVAVDDSAAAGVAAIINDEPNGVTTGIFLVGETDKTGRDNRSRGMLEYVDERYLRWAETGEYFIKQGPDAPENLLAFEDFDGDFKTDGQKDDLVKNYSAHVPDWSLGDPVWHGGKGKGLIGAVNYLESEGLNVFSFLTMNIGGDDRNVFPYTSYTERLRMDVSRLDQWEVVLDHADRKGFYLHFKTQETENETLLDGGDLGTQRKLYYRELIARFGHHLALNWNLGEESADQSDAQRKAMAGYFHQLDPFRRNIVLHTYPGDKNEIYTPLLGTASELTGLSMQGTNSKFTEVHGEVLEWIGKSAAAGKPWVVAYDEPGNAQDGLVNDTRNAVDPAGNGNYTDARKKALWGVLLAGGAGTEYYFGYSHGDSDLTLQNFRSRDLWWDYCRHALDFFGDNEIPFHDMENRNDLVGNAANGNAGGYCFAKTGEQYVVYLPDGGTAELDLSGEEGAYQVRWFDPRSGGELGLGSVAAVYGGGQVSLGAPPQDLGEDWVVLVRETVSVAYIHGDVAQDGTTPSGAAPAYDQMLITETGSTGLSDFRDLVEAEGLAISQHYDQGTTLDEAFLSQFQVVIFGLHQKIWNAAEKDALDAWLRQGGGMWIYSDSASGGRFSIVGAQNTVGQTATNNLIGRYGMEVTVDQANGVKAYRAGSGASHPIVEGRPVLEGEGVSPVAVDPSAPGVEVLVPYVDDPDFKVSGNPTISHTQNLTIVAPEYAALVVRKVGLGNVMAMFDRQPMWNSGVGSNITKRDNREILRRIVAFLAEVPDTDRDGLADDWEELYFHGLAKLPLGDEDGDGATNIEEFLAGTNPKLAGSAFEIVSLEGAVAGGFTVKWPSVEGRVYRIFRSENLDLDWTAISPPMNGTGGEMSFTDPDRRDGKMFYRIGASLP